MIHFEKISKSNFNNCIKIDTGISDDYLKPVVYQIALNHVYPNKIPLAIYENDKVIGFVSYEKDTEPEIAYDILVFVIDKSLQNKGYGSRALKAFIEYLRKFNDCKLITLNYNKDNMSANKLYTKMGFVPSGAINKNNNEIIMKLEIE